ncbi:MAG: nuclear transport factor 2 family protein [Steroidobacteraceae bacterium]|nr:nuclear transport factor 2 family protein [Steroidobacteraceae bacterium]
MTITSHVSVTRLTVAVFALCAFAFQTPLHAQGSRPQVSPDLQAKIAAAYEKAQSIARRAERVRDIDQLRNLQAAYGYYVDKALWDDVVDLFTENGTMELGLNGVYVGKKSIRRYLYSLTGGKPGLRPGELNNHIQLSPVITLAPDGQSAKARWRALIQGGMYGKGSGGDWGSGIYENEYVKENGVWKIQSLHFYVKFYAPYEGGWTKAPKETALRYGKSNVRPDRPPSVKYEPYPAHFTPPFHYENPVTSSYVFGASAPAPKGSSAGSPPRTVAELEACVRRLEHEVDRLQSALDVENLNSIYGYYVDKSMQDAISALFAEESTLEILGRGVFLGRDRIYEYMRRLGAPQQGSLFNHMQLQPYITISQDGTTAKMRTRLFVMFGRTGQAAQWGEGIYENTFVRENGVWKYKNLQGFQTFYTNYDQGWARQSAKIFAPFPGYPPDAPQSVAYDPYPALFTPPFHYRNPVSGR